MSDFKETCVVAYGGSIIIPDEKYDLDALERLVTVCNHHPDTRFVFIIGGGKLCRRVNQEIRPLLQAALDDDEQINVALDEVGISITKVNARTTIAYLQKRLGTNRVCSAYVDDPSCIPTTDAQVIVASGFRPLVTTDYCMMRLAQELHANKAIKISNFPIVLNVKPLEFKKELLDTYETLPTLTWQGILDLVGTEAIAGGNYPLDPPSALLGNELKKTVPDFTLYVGVKEQFEAMLADDDTFIGTLIKN